MPQFTVIFTDGGSYLVTAPDKYGAIEKAKSQKSNSNHVGVKEVRDAGGKKL
ncbi:MAG: hypothetical protein IJW54_01100 [Clostridia bacterium]|nr:hypothetical protein [Clostridia bacterium]